MCMHRQPALIIGIELNCHKQMLIDYSGYATGVEGLGPGKRTVIWLRGCNIGCPGCMTSELWSNGTERPILDLADRIVPLLAVADGLTLSGGEPFDQAGAAAHLIEVLRCSLPELETLVYTGYTLERLRSYADGTCLPPRKMPKSRRPSRDEVTSFLKCIDMLMDGPFNEKAPNTLQWRGSDNQRLHVLSSRANRFVGEPELPMPEQRNLHVQMLQGNRYRIIGIPRRGDLAKLRLAMATRGFVIDSDSKDTQ